MAAHILLLTLSSEQSSNCLSLMDQVRLYFHLMTSS